MSAEFKKSVSYGEHVFEINSISEQASRSLGENAAPNMIVIELVAVDEYGLVNPEFKPFPIRLARSNHASQGYQDISAKNVDTLLKCVGIEAGIAAINNKIDTLVKPGIVKKLRNKMFKGRVFKGKETEAGSGKFYANLNLREDALKIAQDFKILEDDSDSEVNDSFLAE